MKYTKAERQESLDYLRSVLKPGDRVYTILRRVSKSGMSRCISLYIIRDGELLNVTWHAGRAMGSTVLDVHGHWAIRIGGCGMDMGFALVYDLSHTIFPRTADAPDTGYNLRNEWI